MDQQEKVLLSLEACMACLQILAAPNMPKQMYKEERIDKLVGFVRFQLLHNVLVFYDAALCQASRPELLKAGERKLSTPYDRRHLARTIVDPVTCTRRTDSPVREKVPAASLLCLGADAACCVLVVSMSA